MRPSGQRRWKLPAPTPSGLACIMRRPPSQTSMRVRAEALAQLPAPTQSALQLLQAAGDIQPYYDQYLPPRLAEEHKKTTQALFALTLKPAEAAERMAQCAREVFTGSAK